jgi:hypothetical protein
LLSPKTIPQSKRHFGAASGDTGVALTDVLLSEWRAKMSQKHPFSPFLQRICKGLQKRNGYKVLNVSIL